METYNFFSDNDNTSFVDDDEFSNFSLRGKKYHARKRAIEEANKRTNELNTLITAPDVIETVTVPVNTQIAALNPPNKISRLTEKEDLLIKALDEKDKLLREMQTAEVKSSSPTPTGAEVKPSESGITAPNLGTSTSKKNKFILPSVLGAALLIGVLVFLKKKK